MRPLLQSLLLVSGTVALLATDLAASAETDPIVVRVGSSSLTLSEVSRGFGRLFGFQRRKFGTDPVTQLRNYVGEIAVRDLLLAEYGRRSGKLDAAKVRASEQVILGEALVDSLRKSEQRDAPVTDADIKTYYDTHPELFNTPERIRINRLLVDSEVEAKALIEQIKRLPNMDDWRNLVREKSRDRATSERGGDLGFVAADGTTDVPELEIDRGLFAAAQGVKDGEVVGIPVPEGRRFAVVWRRGSLSARTLGLSSESPKIRQQLTNDRLESKLRALIASLRKQHLNEHYPDRLSGREFPLPGDSSPGNSATAPSASTTHRP